MSSTSSDRFPLLLWGDLVKGEAPVLRRALAGWRAHECMYAWVYLTDYLSIHRLNQAIPALDDETRNSLLYGLQGALWTKLDRSQIDPHYQISPASFEMGLLASAFAAVAGSRQPTFVELGSTFFASRTRFDIINKVAKPQIAGWPDMAPRWIGVDNSQFMHDVTKLLHGEQDITLLSDFAALGPQQGFSAFLSRFVVSYVFPSGRAFAEYAASRFQAIIVEDAFSTTDRDIEVFNHGQRETFMSLPETLRTLEAAAFDIHLLDSYPDYPAGTAPCHVVKFFAVKRPIDTARALDITTQLGFSIAQTQKKISSTRALADLNTSVSQEKWRVVEHMKRISPVWGPTTASAPAPKADRPTNAQGWGNYTLAGEMAEAEIERALREDKKLV